VWHGVLNLTSTLVIERTACHASAEVEKLELKLRTQGKPERDPGCAQCCDVVAAKFLCLRHSG
jgi:hypothetical protein